MANTQRMGGYNCNFVEDPPDYLNCLICLSVTRDPQQHGDCGKLFCNSCITEYKKTSNDCPHCRQNLVTFNDGRSAQEVKSLKVKCDNDDKGCQWVGDLRSLEEHLLTCDYSLLPCSNECENESGGIVKVLRKDLPDHLANKCSRRQYPCPHCEEVGEYKERKTTHIETCPKVKVQCPNDQCQVSIPRCEVGTHRSTCEYERVSCKYAEIGCEEMLPRKKLKLHQEDNQLHFRITAERVLQQNKMIKLLETGFCLLKRTNPSQCTFRMTNYQRHKLYKDEFCSPPFDTSPTGYKMCITIYANGNGKGEGAHVSVFVHFMMGKYDDFLTWPFTGSVIIELLNQLEDKNHHKYKIESFPADSDISQKVTQGKRGNGWGSSRFISHTELDYNPEKNCQYLDHDILVFRISVDVSKPWLECTV